MKETRRLGVASFVVIMVGNFLLMVGAYLSGAETIWEKNLLPVYFVAGALGTVGIWALVLGFGRYFIRRASEPSRLVTTDDPATES